MNIDIFQLTDILKRRWYYPVAGMFLCILLAVGVILYVTPVYTATATLIIDPGKLDVPVVSQTGNGVALQSNPQLADSQIYLMSSREVLGDVVDALRLQDDSYLVGKTVGTPEARKNAAIAGLVKKMTIAREAQSLVFSISVKHPVSATASDIANKVAETYLSYVSASRSQTASRSASALQQQTEELRVRLTAAQQAVEDFKAEHGLFSTGAKGLVQDQTLEAANAQLAQAREDAAVKQAAYEESRGVSVEDVEAGAITEAIQSAALASLRTRYAQLLDTQAQLSANLGANHPKLKAAQSQANSMRKSIEAELARIRESLKNEYLRSKTKLSALEREFDAATKATGEKADVKTQLAQLESEAKAVDALYQAALSNAGSLSGQNSGDPGSARVISAAVPPSQPKGLPKTVILVAAAMFGFAAGCGLAILRTAFDGVVAARRIQPASASRPSMQQPVVQSGIPVVARLRAEMIEGAGHGNLVRFPSNRRPQNQVQDNRARAMGRMRVAHILETAAAEAGPSEDPYRVLFISSAGGAVAGFNLRGIAVMLANGSQVWLADDQAAVAARPSIVRSGSVKISVDARQVTNTFRWQGIGLTFEQIVPEYPHQEPQPGAFALVDACGSTAEDMLPVLLHSCDAIMVVSKHGETSETEMEELTQFLQPWQGKILGRLSVEPS